MKSSRRHFLTTLGATASATLLAPSVFDFKLLAGTPFVRQDVGGLAATDPILVGYETAIAAMQALPATDPRSWSFQAAIHATNTMPANPAWNMCQHGTPLFWAWHRMYLYWWERIVRHYSGDANWALPYWKWTTETKLPAPFRVTTSNLYTSNRDAAMNNGTGSLPASDVDYSVGFAELNYYTAQSEVEVTPHDAVHVDIGGWMADIPTAAQDPIFYLHHANMDRLWDLWLAQAGGRADPTSDATWTGVTFDFFDETGSTVSMTPCDVLNAASQLNYTYEGEPPQVKQTCDIIPPWIFRYLVLLEFPWPPTPIDGDPYMVPVDLSTVLQQLVAILQNPDQQVYLQLNGVTTKTQPGVTWEVYVGLPVGVAPGTALPSYVGKMALFGPGVRSDAHGNFKAATLTFNATKALAAVVNPGGVSATVSFYARGILVDGKRVKPVVESTVNVTSAEFRVSTRSRK
jgi:hypothetical protein